MNFLFQPRHLILDHPCGALLGDGGPRERPFPAQLQAHCQALGHGQPAAGAPERLQRPLLGGGAAVKCWQQQQLGQRRRRRQQPLRQNSHGGSAIFFAGRVFFVKTNAKEC